MIHNMTGGAAGLNLKVVGGTTRPTGAENTIWVNTSTAIGSYAFSAAQPTSPASGMLWFKTAASSNAAINVDKKNTVLLYPTGCKQYVSGAWVNKTAQTYQGGAWKDWGLYLYHYGETDLGFEFTKNSFSQASGLAGDHIYLAASYKTQASATAAATSATDLTPYSTAAVELSATLTDGTGTTSVGFGTEKGSYDSAFYSCTTLNRQVVEIDISGLKGSYFFSASRSNGAGETKIYSVYLR